MQKEFITKKTSKSPTDSNCYEYPVPDLKNKILYKKYRERANTIPKLLICGRLGEYCYYDMDQAIERAIKLPETNLRKD